MLDGEPPAPPEDQLAHVLLELDQAVFLLRRLRTQVIPQLMGPAAMLADDLEAAVARAFPGRAA